MSGGNDDMTGAPDARRENDILHTAAAIGGVQWHRMEMRARFPLASAVAAELRALEEDTKRRADEILAAAGFDGWAVGLHIESTRDDGKEE